MTTGSHKTKLEEHTASLVIYIGYGLDKMPDFEKQHFIKSKQK